MIPAIDSVTPLLSCWLINPSRQLNTECEYAGLPNDPEAGTPFRFSVQETEHGFQSWDKVGSRVSFMCNVRDLLEVPPSMTLGTLNDTSNANNIFLSFNYFD